MKLNLITTIAVTFLTCGSSFAQSLVYEGDHGVGNGKHIVFIANDHEYRSEQTCPAMAKILAKRFGFRCTVLFGIDESGRIKAGDAPVPGMEALKDADLLFFFTRFMQLPDDQVDLLVDYFELGGPVVGLRTSTHCFNGQKGKWSKLNFNYEGDDYRGGLGEQIFGNTWHDKRGQSHYGPNHQKGSLVVPVSDSVEHPILKGVEPIHSWCGAYKSQTPSDATEILHVQVLNKLAPGSKADADKPLVSAGWTRKFYVAPSGLKKEARVAYVSFGASEDLLDGNARRCLVNACLWAIGLENKIESNSNVDLVGSYHPSPFSMGTLFFQDVFPSELSSWESQVMPAGKKLAGVTNPKMIKRVKRAVAQRPELNAKLSKLYPDIYGAEAKPFGSLK